MTKQFYIITILFALTIVSCDSEKHLSDKGKVIYDPAKYDIELLSAIQAIGKDSTDKNKLWSNFHTTEIQSDNFSQTWGGLTTDITVKQSRDSIIISYSQPSADEKGNIYLQGFAFKIMVSSKEYTFIDNSWSDYIEKSETKVEYSPFYLQKEHYKIGDTLRGCLTIKTSKVDNDKITLTKYLKFAINSIVTK